MSLLVLLVIQATASAPVETIVAVVPPPCKAGRSANDEIVVCAPRQEGLSPYRINPSPTRQRELPKAEVQLAEGVSASAETEQADVGGFPANRVMVRLKFKF